MTKRLTSLALIAVAFLFTNCEANEFNPSPNASVVSYNDDCGGLLRFYESQDGFDPSPENIYIAVNLRKSFRVPKKQLIISARPATEAEMIECTENPNGYKQIYIINAVEYSDTDIFINNN